MRRQGLSVSKAFPPYLLGDPLPGSSPLIRETLAVEVEGETQGPRGRIAQR